MLKPLLLVICLPFRSFGRSIENNRCFCIRKWLQQKHWGESKRVKGRTGRWKQGGGGWEKGARRRGHRAAQAEADCLRDQVVFMLYPIHEGEMSVRNVACHAPHLHPYLLVYHTEPAPPAFSSVSHMAQVSIPHGPSTSTRSIFSVNSVYAHVHLHAQLPHAADMGCTCASTLMPPTSLRPATGPHPSPVTGVQQMHESGQAVFGPDIL